MHILPVNNYFTKLQYLYWYYTVYTMKTNFTFKTEHGNNIYHTRHIFSSNIKVPTTNKNLRQSSIRTLIYRPRNVHHITIRS